MYIIQVKFGFTIYFPKTTFHIQGNGGNFAFTSLIPYTFFRSPEPKDQMNFCHSSVVCCDTSKIVSNDLALHSRQPDWLKIDHLLQSSSSEPIEGLK